MMCLVTHNLSIHSYSTEPFLRPGGVEQDTQSQYVGVFKVDTDHNLFGIDFPLLNIDKCTMDSFTLPPCCTTGGTRIVLRTDLENEYVAGQLYAYVIRILYGDDGVKLGLLQNANQT